MSNFRNAEVAGQIVRLRPMRRALCVMHGTPWSFDQIAPMLVVLTAAGEMQGCSRVSVLPAGNHGEWLTALLVRLAQVGATVPVTDPQTLLTTAGGRA